MAYVLSGSALVIIKPHLEFSVIPLAVYRVKFNFPLMLIWITASSAIVYIRKLIGETDKTYISIACVFAVFTICRTTTGLVSLVLKINYVFMPNFHPETNKYNILAEVLLLIVTINYLSAMILVFVFVIYDSTLKLILGSLVPPEYFTLPVKVLVVLVHVYLFSVGLANNLILLCVHGFWLLCNVNFNPGTSNRA